MFTRTNILINLALGASAFAGLSAAQSMFRGDAAHSAIYPGAGPRQFHSVKWKFVTGAPVISSPAWHEGILYFGSDDGNVYAVDAATGRQQWKFQSAGPVPATPAVAGGLVYFPSYDGKFYAVDALTGKLRWKTATGGERRFEAKGLHGMQPKNQTMADPYDLFLSSPVVASGVVYFGSGDGNLYALDATTGEVRWKFKTNNVVHSSPAYASGTLYFGSWDSYFYAVDAATGKEKWRFHGGEDELIHNQVGFQSSPVIAGGFVYTGCRDSNVYALDASTGKESWHFNNQGSWVISSPAVVNGKLLFATSDSSLFQALDAATGKQLYKQDTKAYVFSSPAVAGDTVYYGVLNGTLEARDLNTGELLWDYRTEASKKNRGWLLTSDRKFNTVMLYPSGWRESASYAVERQYGLGAIASSPLIANGVVYFGSGDGYLYAIE